METFPAQSNSAADGGASALDRQAEES